MALINLTKEQNEELKALHVKATDNAEMFHKTYRMSKLRKYLTLAECEVEKARAYWELGNFDEDARYRKSQ